MPESDQATSNVLMSEIVSFWPCKHAACVQNAEKRYFSFGEELLIDSNENVVNFHRKHDTKLHSNYLSACLCQTEFVIKHKRTKFTEHLTTANGFGFRVSA